MSKVKVELYLFRHGESYININSYLISGRSNESPLTQRGIDQAKMLGSSLKARGITPSKVYSSPAARALQTATYTLEAMGLDITPNIDNALQELDQGEWVGRLRHKVYTEATLAAIKRQGKSFKAPGGESMDEVGARMLKWANRCAADKSSGHTERILAFTHGLAIQCLASILHDWTHTRTYQAAIDNVSISLFTNQGGQWQLKHFGIKPDLF